MKEGREEDDIVEGHGHTAAGEWVPHVEGVAEEDEAGLACGGGREEGVGHAAEGAVFESRTEGRLDLAGKGGEDDV